MSEYFLGGSSFGVSPSLCCPHFISSSLKRLFYCCCQLAPGVQDVEVAHSAKKNFFPLDITQDAEQINHMHKIITTKIFLSLWIVGGLRKFLDSNVVVIHYLSVERKEAKQRLRQNFEVEGILLHLTSAT